MDADGKTIRKSGKEKKYLANRELSWLQFNERVLEEAADRSVPLCERLSFLSIFQSNLDEFFMVRVGSLYDQMLVNKNATDNKTGMTNREQLMAIFEAARILSGRKDLIYRECMEELEGAGATWVSFSSVLPEDKVYLENYFVESLLPLLSPQVIGKKQPFPFLKNREIYAVVVLGTKNSDKLGIIPCSNEIFGRLVAVPSAKNRYILVEDLILHYLPRVFEHYTVKSKSLIRITRNADIDVDEAFYDEDLDYRDSMEKLIRVRKRLCPVRLEHSRVLDDTVVEKLRGELGLFPEQVFYSETPLEMSYLFQVQDCLRERRDLFYERRVPQLPAGIREDMPMIAQIEEKDRFLSFPYESMKPFIRLLKEAGTDENVVSIRMTLYRVAKNSQIVEALIDAAENGKEVVVLVELRARFDEENNIEWSRRLEEAGCRIIYGIDHIKVHSKLCQITYKKEDGIHHITQVGTGNYNEKTAKLYTDLSLMTADERIGEEAAEVFHALCLAELVEHTEHLLVAPKCLQDKVLGMMDDEICKAKAGSEGYIGLKMNALTDKTIIDKLVEASQAGVKIDLIIRGICCLIAGVPGYTENISVTSIVGRYLEHSRIYIFGKPDSEQCRIYIASADFMTRNTTKRVEVAAPILDADIRERIISMFNLILRDNVKAQRMRQNGNYYHSPKADVQLNSQEYFYALAYQRLERDTGKMTGTMNRDEKKIEQLRKIIREKRIRPVYQPIVSLKTGNIAGYEALSRIDQPDSGLGVEEMFALAGEAGACWELEELCRERSIQGAGGKLKGKKLFLNVSPEIVKDKKFREGVTVEYLSKNSMSAEDIIFEVTERTAISDAAVFMEALEHYQKQNYKIAIDDMGSGYAGLNRVCRLGPDYVKVDMELVRGINRDYLKEAIVESFARFCTQTGIHLIAEGIETEEELRTLIGMGVEYGQGYFLQRPAEEFSEMIPLEKVSLIRGIREKKRRHDLMPSFFGSVGTICTETMVVEPDVFGYDVFQEFEKNADLTECCVVDREGNVIGVLTRAELFKRFGGRYGFNLNGRHTAEQLADREFLSFEADTPIEIVSKLALKRSAQKLYDAVVIMEEDHYQGVATVKNLLDAAISIQVKRAVDANPLTGLPGNTEIEQRVRECIREGEPFSITYLDLDNFKAYNDAYGFNNGDQMIKLLADLMEENCGEDVFKGHIGGDDFVLIASNWNMKNVCQTILNRFAEGVRHLYNQKDLENGYICSKNRNGFEDIFPLASVSIAVITNRQKNYQTLTELSEIIAQTKKKSKMQKGNSYVEA